MNQGHEEAKRQLPHNVLFVTFEGNIGAGKSTLMESLRESLGDEMDVTLANEPVCEWVKSGLLQGFDTDPQANALRFQKAIFAGRLKWERDLVDSLASKPGLHVILCERSSNSDAIFAEVNTRLGNITQAGLEEYKTMAAQAGPRIVPDLCIYLATKPEYCLRNILERDRMGEENITEAYLAALDLAHTEHDWSNAGRTEVKPLICSYTFNSYSYIHRGKNVPEVVNRIRDLHKTKLTRVAFDQ